MVSWRGRDPLICLYDGEDFCGCRRQRWEEVGWRNLEEFGAFGGIGRIAIGAVPVRAVRSDELMRRPNDLHVNGW